MADDHKEILDKIAEVKTELDDVQTSVKNPPNAATSAQLDAKTTQILAAVDKGKSEKKEWWEAYLEGLGFKDILGAIKDQTSLTSMLPLAIAGGLAIVFGKVFDFGKLFNAGFEKLTKKIAHLLGRTSSEGRILAMTDSGVPWARRRREAEAAPIIAMAASTLTPTQLNDLKAALEGVNPPIRLFNSRARKLPSARMINGATKAIQGLNPVIAAADPDKIGQVADALNKFDPNKIPDPRKLAKINKVVKDADPQAMKDIAKGAGKLVGVQQHLDPARWQALPKGRTLATAAKSAERLAKAGFEVGRAFDALKTAAVQATSAIGAPSGS
ncbi:hypothetical protein ACFTWS_09165 [Streptomyces sp. NPDC057027]|uniref:hypothetical protein n=1 Tax=Streptomyces sp. NPDC057027 TaxID=3346004 RepID=UPI003634426A